MKTLLSILTVTALALSPAMADKNVKAGPRHGRVLEMPSQSAEFFVEKDRTVSIAFYDAAMKPLAPSSQVVTATAEAPTGKTKLEFERRGNLLVSKAPLPAGEGFTIVVQVKPAADAKSKNFRVPLMLHICKGCNNPEYACTCDE